MKLLLFKYNQLIYRNDDILDLQIDPICYSGIEYWSQEARSAKVTVLMDPLLEDILIGSRKDVIAGFYAFSADIFDSENNRIYKGALKLSDISIEYTSLTAKTVDMEFIDYLGLIIELSSNRIFRIENQYIDPIATIPNIISSIIAPSTNDPEPENQNYTNADVRKLIQRIGVINWLFAHLSYDYSKWTPILLTNHVLISTKDLKWGNNPSTQNMITFGFDQSDEHNYFIYWQYTHTPPHNFSQHLRYRRFLITHDQLTLVDATDDHNTDQSIAWPQPQPPTLQRSLNIGDANYWIDSLNAYYTGFSSIQNIQVVPGDYSATELMGELLRVANAALTIQNYDFNILNRNDTDLPQIHIEDPLSFSIDQADNNPPKLSPVAIASQDILDAIENQYSTTLNELPHQAHIKTLLSADELKNNGISQPNELLARTIRFQSFLIKPLEIDFDLQTKEIDISGRAKHL